jgi:hypothetical protein
MVERRSSGWTLPESRAISPGRIFTVKFIVKTRSQKIAFSVQQRAPVAKDNDCSSAGSFLCLGTSLAPFEYSACSAPLRVRTRRRFPWQPVKATNRAQARACLGKGLRIFSDPRFVSVSSNALTCPPGARPVPDGWHATHRKAEGGYVRCLGPRRCGYHGGISVRIEECPPL